MEESQNDDTRGKRLACINLEMVPTKATYFFNSAALASVFPFLNLFYVSSGLTPTQAGICSAVENIFSMFAVPLWGAFIDSTKHHKILLIILVLGTAITKFSKPWVVFFVTKFDNSTLPYNESVFMDRIVHMNSIEHPTIHKVSNPTAVFVGLLLSGIIASIFYSGVMSFVEGTTVKVIYSRKEKLSYGAQKLLAPIGFAFGSFIAGLAVDNYTPSGNMPQLAAAFFVYLPLKLMLIPILYIITRQADWGMKRPKGNREEIKATLQKGENKIFLLSVFVSGICLRIYTEFSCLFMQTELNSTKTLMSLMMVTAMVSEVAIYPFTAKIITACGGPMHCVLLGIASYIPRYLLISYVKNKWYMLPIQLIHGIGMALSWAAQVEHTYQIFPKESTTAALGLTASLHFIVSSVVVNFAGGALYTKFGGRVLFRGTAILAGIWSLLLLVYFGCSEMSSKRRNKENAEKQPAEISEVAVSCNNNQNKDEEL